MRFTSLGPFCASVLLWSLSVCFLSSKSFWCSVAGIAQARPDLLFAGLVPLVSFKSGVIWAQPLPCICWYNCQSCVTVVSVLQSARKFLYLASFASRAVCLNCLVLAATAASSGGLGLLEFFLSANFWMKHVFFFFSVHAFSASPSHAQFDSSSEPEYFSWKSCVAWCLFWFWLVFVSWTPLLGGRCHVEVSVSALSQPWCYLGERQVTGRLPSVFYFVF